MNITKKDVTFHIGDKKVTKKGYLIKIKDGEYPPILHNSGKNNIIDTPLEIIFKFRNKNDWLDFWDKNKDSLGACTILWTE